MKLRLRGRAKVKKWVQKGRKKQKGGFLSLIISALIALGMTAEAASATAAVVAPVAAGLASGAASAVGAKVVNSISGSGKRRVIRRIRR